MSPSQLISEELLRIFICYLTKEVEDFIRDKIPSQVDKMVSCLPSTGKPTMRKLSWCGQGLPPSLAPALPQHPSSTQEDLGPVRQHLCPALPCAALAPAWLSRGPAAALACVLEPSERVGRMRPLDTGPRAGPVLGLFTRPVSCK